MIQQISVPMAISCVMQEPKTHRQARKFLVWPMKLIQERAPAGTSEAPHLQAYGWQKSGDQVWGTRAVAPSATPLEERRPRKLCRAAPGIHIKHDITLVDACKVGLISERALNILTIKPKDSPDYTPLTMLSEAVALMKSAPKGSGDEGKRQQQLRMIVENAISTTTRYNPVECRRDAEEGQNPFLDNPAVRNRAERNLKVFLRKDVQQASTAFGRDIAIYVDPKSDPDAQDRILTKYKKIKVLHQPSVT
jgi:hypothetical protein